MKERRPADLENVAARYIMYGKHMNADGTVKPAALIPYRHVECSVTLHSGRNEEAIWHNGEDVAKLRGCSLAGRVDMPVSTIRESSDERIKMDVVHEPIREEDNMGYVNEHHAEIIGWPKEKNEQKSIAMKILKGLKALRRK